MFTAKNGLIVLSAAGLLLASATHANAQYYKGKTINVIIGFGPGGIDTFARIYTRHMKKYIPGNPNIVVRSMPGAASLKSVNFMKDKAPKDGTTVSYNPWQAMAELTNAPGVKFSYKDFTLLGGVAAKPSVAVARAALIPGGIKRGADIVKAKNLVYTGRNRTHNLDLETVMAAEILGLKFRYVPGYRSGSKIAASIEQNETNFTGAGISMYNGAFNRVVTNGTVVPLWYYPPRDAKGNYAEDKVVYKGMKSFFDVYKEVHGKAPSGEVWEAYSFFMDLRGTMGQILFGPPGMNKEAAAILRKAFKQAATTDPDARADLHKVFRGAVPDYTPFDKAVAAIDSIANPDPKIKAFWQARMDAARAARKKAK